MFDSDVYPAGLSDELILPAAATALQSCAQAVVLKPANCPQAVRDDVYNPAKVHWTLYGDPVEGAIVRYSTGQFHVLGSAIMLASYTSTTDGDGKALRIVSYSVTARYSVWLSGEQEETQSGDYDAVLAMRDGKPELLQITDV